ncbi:transcription factor S [Candidatus Woesearchaeota archaeon]|nr:transcription factor S [Candidatus Woesearchaeota archaeon]
MDFCPKCGSIMIPTKKDKKLVMVCPSCGEHGQEQEDSKIKEVIESKDRKIDLVIDSAEDSTMPLTEVECPTCKHTKAYYWTVQTRAGDEPETKFLKCEQCKHVWRDYS